LLKAIHKLHNQKLSDRSESMTVASFTYSVSLRKETFLIYFSTMSTTRVGLFNLSPVLQCVLQKHRTVGISLSLFLPLSLPYSLATGSGE